MSTLFTLIWLIFYMLIDVRAVWKGIYTALRFTAVCGLAYAYVAGGFVVGHISPHFPYTVTRWERLIVRSAQNYNLDPNALATIMLVESCGNPEALSGAGAIGLMQVMPFNFMPHELPLAYDPAVNIEKGAAVYRMFLNAAGGDVNKAFAGYNGGFLALDSRNWSEETQRYDKWTRAVYKGILTGDGQGVREFVIQHKFGCLQAELVQAPDMTITQPLPTWLTTALNRPAPFLPTGQSEVILPYPANVSPILVDNGFHGAGEWPGRDWITPCGTPLYAPISGTITRKGVDSYVGPHGANNSYLGIENKALGLEVVMMHGDYSAEVGQEVVQGYTVVGVERSRGNSTDCHTHLAIKKNGQIIDPLTIVGHN